MEESSTGHCSQIQSQVSGKFAKECGCLTHTSNKTRLLNMTTSQRRKLGMESLIENCLLPKRAKYVCKECVGTGGEPISIPGEEVTIEMTEERQERHQL